MCGSIKSSKLRREMKLRDVVIAFECFLIDFVEARILRDSLV
jgi:hypothetical protein